MLAGRALEVVDHDRHERVLDILDQRRLDVVREFGRRLADRLHVGDQRRRDAAVGAHLHLGAKLWIAPHEDGQRIEGADRSEEHTSELQSLMRISYAVFCLKKKITRLAMREKTPLKNQQLHT